MVAEAVMRDGGSSFQKLTDEAFADLLKKAQAAGRAEGRAQGACRRATRMPF